MMSILLGLLYMSLVLLTNNRLIGFFDLGSDEVERMARQFLMISIFGTVFPS